MWAFVRKYDPKLRYFKKINKLKIENLETFIKEDLKKSKKGSAFSRLDRIKDIKSHIDEIKKKIDKHE